MYLILFFAAAFALAWLVFAVATLAARGLRVPWNAAQQATVVLVVLMTRRDRVVRDT
jgi:hypothetical protein